MSTDTWISKNSCKMRTMKILCMNPAIVFAPLARTVRSVILASGTLSPMSSFESELGTKFHNKPSNLKHIITKDQLHVRCIPRGPTNKPLSATYEKVNSFDFQVREFLTAIIQFLLSHVVEMTQKSFLIFNRTSSVGWLFKCATRCRTACYVSSRLIP